jgi:hypothetical protein
VALLTHNRPRIGPPSSAKVLELPICPDALGGTGLFPTVVTGFENRRGLFCFVNFSEVSKIDQQPRTQESILPEYRWSHFSLLGLSNEFSSKAR